MRNISLQIRLTYLCEMQYMCVMQSHSDIIRALGGYQKVAAICAVPDGTASSWVTRNSIPSDHWPALAASGVSIDVLAATKPRRARPEPPE